MDLQYFAGCPNLQQTNVRFNLTEVSTYAYIVWKILFFQCNFCNIWWVTVMATMVKGKAGHMSDVMLTRNQFKEVRS